MVDDARRAAADYRLEQWERERLAEEARTGPDTAADEGAPADAGAERPAGRSTGGTAAAERASYVEVVIQQAIRRGEFDDLPGAGKPLTGLDRHDPDWWIRRKIEQERLTGLGPPALSLRVESAELEGRLDAMHREPEVRAVLADFNARVIEARRQLLGGPPVVTPTRDVDAEVLAWRARRDARHRVQAEAAELRSEGEAERRRRWWRRAR